MKTIAHHELGLHLINQIISNIGLVVNLFLGTQNVLFPRIGTLICHVLIIDVINSTIIFKSIKITQVKLVNMFYWMYACPTMYLSNAPVYRGSNRVAAYVVHAIMLALIAPI